MHSILIVEDKESMAQMLKETLTGEGYSVETAGNFSLGAEMMAQGSPDMLLTDLKLPDKDGIHMLKASKDENPLRPVIVMTAFGSVETAVTAMKEGAYDFITKPLNIDHLLMLIRRALENQTLLKENILLKQEHESRFGLPDIIGTSPEIQDVADKARKVASAKTTVLLLGESGTGKELFARAIHYLSGRSKLPFVPINCAAIPDNLLESELFGYEKGAFSGAESRKLGKFELAHKGTVFLDEICELKLDLQAKLLRVIQEGEIERVGGTKSIRIDVRIIAASNRKLDQMVKGNEFREDLYYRLSVFPITIPPLRQRRSDIPLLAENFVSKHASDINPQVKHISTEALEALNHDEWKGNVRELENTLERAMIFCEGDTILAQHISLAPLDSAGSLLGELPMDGSLEEVAKGALKIVETDRIKRALQDCAGNKSKAAIQLKVSYKTLLTKIKDYGINRA